MIDWDRPVRTKDGREVNIWTTSAKCRPDYPVRGETKAADSVWVTCTWNKDGHYWKKDSPHDSDLENIPEKREGWIIEVEFANKPFTTIYHKEDMAVFAANAQGGNCKVKRIEYEV